MLPLGENPVTKISPEHSQGSSLVLQYLSSFRLNLFYENPSDCLDAIWRKMHAFNKSRFASVVLDDGCPRTFVPCSPQLPVSFFIHLCRSWYLIPCALPDSGVQYGGNSCFSLQVKKWLPIEENAAQRQCVRTGSKNHKKSVKCILPLNCTSFNRTLWKKYANI